MHWLQRNALTRLNYDDAKYAEKNIMQFPCGAEGRCGAGICKHYYARVILHNV